MYYDLHAKQLPILNENDQIIFKKNGKEWHYGKVARRVSDRSYIVVDNIGNFYRRNRRHIAKANHNDINTSEMLYEEHIDQYLNSNESKVVPPANQGILLTANDECFTEADRSLHESNDSSLYFDADDQESFGENVNHNNMRRHLNQLPQRHRIKREVDELVDHHSAMAIGFELGRGNLTCLI